MATTTPELHMTQTAPTATLSIAPSLLTCQTLSLEQRAMQTLSTASIVVVTQSQQHPNSKQTNSWEHITIALLTPLFNNLNFNHQREGTLGWVCATAPT